MIKQKYKAVIFDLDDTLVETRSVKWAQHKHVAKKFYNIDLSEETLLKHYGKPFPILIQELYEHSDTPENMLQAYNLTRGDFLKTIYSGSIDVVNKLLDSGIKVGILSAANKNYIMDDLTRLKFPIERLIEIQGPQDTLAHKPDPRVFLLLLNKLKKEGIKKTEIVYVGDSLNDLKAATGAGIDFIAVTTGLYSFDDFKKNGAKIIIKNMQEFLELI